MIHRIIITIFPLMQMILVKKEGIVSGFHIIEDPTGQIHELFASYKKAFDLKTKETFSKTFSTSYSMEIKKTR